MFIRALIATMTFAVPLSQVPHALAAASGPGVATMFPLQTYSSASVQHFNVIFEESLTGVTEQQIMIDGTAPGCTRVPFRASGVVFDVAVSGCGDGDIRVGVAMNSLRDSLGNLGPAAAVWSDYTHISHAIPNFGLGGLRDTGNGTFEFHLYAPTGILTTNVSAFQFDYPTCVASQAVYNSTDITYSVSGCPVAVPLNVKLDPYSFFDWYANAGPASQMVSPPITLASAVLPAPMPVPTPSLSAVATVSPSPAASLSASPSATSSAAPATATIAQMIGLGAGPTPPDELVTAKPEASAPTASVTSPKDSVTAPLASDSGLVTMPSNQDEPARSYGTQRTTTDILQNETTPTAPPQIYKPVELKSEPNNPWMKIAGGVVTAIGLVALAVSATKLRTRMRVKRTSGVRVAI